MRAAAAPPAWAALLLPLLLGAPLAALGQQLTPFQGQGVPPEAGAEVFVSVVVDRLLGIDDRSYQFEVCWWRGCRCSGRRHRCGL